MRMLPAAALAACVALPGAACASNSTARSPAAAYPSVHTLAERYLAIAVAGNRRLEVSFDRFDGEDRHDLARSVTDLRNVAATERLFDRQLLGLRFPPSLEVLAQLLVQNNEARAALTLAAAGSTSLAALTAWRPRLTAANGPVEQLVRLIRAQLGLPPPDTS